MIVADANILIYLVRETSFTAVAREVYARDSEWVAPQLWEAEVLNGLMREVTCGSLDLESAIRVAQYAATVLADRVQQCERSAVLRIADDTGLTAYDAYYVALARTLGVKLVTEDGKILRTCPDVALSMKALLALKEPPPAVRETRVAYRTRPRGHGTKGRGSRLGNRSKI
jgi:predicted nucleic acid-binding protein